MTAYCHALVSLGGLVRLGHEQCWSFKSIYGVAACEIVCLSPKQILKQFELISM
jgi:hypothetical protein